MHCSHQCNAVYNEVPRLALNGFAPYTQTTDPEHSQWMQRFSICKASLDLDKPSDF